MLHIQWAPVLFLGVKRLGVKVNHSTPSWAKVMVWYIFNCNWVNTP